MRVGRSGIRSLPGRQDPATGVALAFLVLVVVGVAGVVAWMVRVGADVWESLLSAVLAIPTTAVSTVVLCTALAAVHVGGRVVAALVLRFRILAVTVGTGRRLVAVESGRFLLDVRVVPLTYGVVALTWSRWAYRARAVAFHAAGAVASLLAALLLMAVAPADGSGRGFVFLAAAFLLVDTLRCLVPWPGVHNDAQLIRAVLRSRELPPVVEPWLRTVLEVQATHAPADALAWLDAAVAASGPVGDGLRADPVLFHNLRGSMLLLQARAREAAAELDPVPVDAPDGIAGPGIVANNIAYACLLTGDPGWLGRALAASAVAVERAPDAATVLDTRGWALAETGRSDEALALLDRCLSMPLGPAQRAEVQAHRAVALLAANRPEDAREALDRATDLDPTSPSAGLLIARHGPPPGDDGSVVGRLDRVGSAARRATLASPRSIVSLVLGTAGFCSGVLVGSWVMGVLGGVAVLITVLNYLAAAGLALGGGVYRVGPAGWEIRAKGTTVQVPWGDIERLRRSDGYWRLRFVHGSRIVAIPTAAFEPEAHTTLVRLAAEHGFAVGDDGSTRTRVVAAVGSLAFGTLVVLTSYTAIEADDPTQRAVPVSVGTLPVPRDGVPVVGDGYAMLVGPDWSPSPVDEDGSGPWVETDAWYVGDAARATITVRGRESDLSLEELVSGFRSDHEGREGTANVRAWIVPGRSGPLGVIERTRLFDDGTLYTYRSWFAADDDVIVQFEVYALPADFDEAVRLAEPYARTLAVG